MKYIDRNLLSFQSGLTQDEIQLLINRRHLTTEIDEHNEQRILADAKYVRVLKYKKEMLNMPYPNGLIGEGIFNYHSLLLSSLSDSAQQIKTYVVTNNGNFITEFASGKDWTKAFEQAVAFVYNYSKYATKTPGATHIGKAILVPLTAEDMIDVIGLIKDAPHLQRLKNKMVDSLRKSIERLDDGE